jgi:hypothetical protein
MFFLYWAEHPLDLKLKALKFGGEFYRKEAERRGLFTEEIRMALRDYTGQAQPPQVMQAGGD